MYVCMLMHKKKRLLSMLDLSKQMTVIRENLMNVYSGQLLMQRKNKSNGILIILF
jgi:hypothetical protein